VIIYYPLLLTDWILKVNSGCEKPKVLQLFFRTIHQSFAKVETAFDFKLCGKITRLETLGG